MVVRYEVSTTVEYRTGVVVDVGVVAGYGSYHFSSAVLIEIVGGVAVLLEGPLISSARWVCWRE